ncbi:diguanylate cyclase [Silanimonas sp.]|jgi:diguanylate cyclase (GGDEF)-like protein|uniref:diguanylate cyclase n=1 Tax=Silanimonas sp. TaxID=1929290 RepID=UPI0037C73BE8
MLRPPRHGWILGLLLVTPVVWGNPEPAGADAAAFDAAFATAMREGMGTTPAEGTAAVEALRATLPANDALRSRRFDAMACGAAQHDRKAYIANADTLLAAEQARSAPDATSLALLHACRAAYLVLGTDATVVERAYDAAVEAAQRSADPMLLGSMLSLRSDAHSVSGKFAKSLMDALAAQDVLDDSGERFAIAANLQIVGIAFRRMGEYARAEEYLLRSLEDEEIRSRWANTMTALLQLGYLYDETGRYDEARRMLADALELCQRHKNHAACGYARVGLAGVEVDDGAPRRALAALEQAEADFAESGDPGDPTMVALLRGQALARLGRDAEALPLLDRAVATWTTEGNDRYLALALPERARLLERLGREADAIADLRSFIEVNANDDRMRAEQRTDFMREQFDASRREVENAELKAREALRLQEIEGLNAARRWQWTAISLAVVLVIVLLVMVARQIAKARRLRLLAMTDPLTGLANRRHTDYRGSEAFKRARLTAQPFCVLAIDIDHFKLVNDTHGHAVGDTVLQRVGRECQRTLRQNDLIGRIGGEEFTGLLPVAAEPAARQVAERLRAGVESLNLDDVALGLRVTISIGVARMRDSDTNFAGLLSRADAAMYRAKQSGRNRVVSDETA